MNIIVLFLLIAGVLLLFGIGYDLLNKYVFTLSKEDQIGKRKKPEYMNKPKVSKEVKRKRVIKRYKKRNNEKFKDTGMVSEDEYDINNL